MWIADPDLSGSTDSGQEKDAISAPTTGQAGDRGAKSTIIMLALKKESRHRSEVLDMTPPAGMSMHDQRGAVMPRGGLEYAYWLEHEVSVFSDIVNTLTNEILRNGITWAQAYTTKCQICGNESDKSLEKCEICGSSAITPPDSAQLRYFLHAPGESYLKRANNSGQSLLRVLEIFSFHLEVSNRGILLITKAYFSDSDGKITDAIPLEITALDPRYVTPVIDVKTGRMGGGGRVCIRHQNRTRLSEDDSVCPVCGAETYDIHYVTNMPSAPERYYIEGEMLFVSKYGPDLFGYPAIYKLLDDAIAFHHLEKRVRSYYQKGRVPGLLSIPTNSLDTLKSMWDKIMANLQHTPHYFPWISHDPNSHGGIQYIKLMEDPSPDMLAVKDDIRRRMGSWFGVTPLWQNDTASSGGLNNEKQQLTVSNRAFARGQRIINEDVLPWLCRQFSITDWVLTLIPAEDADGLRDEQLMSAKLDNVQKALQVGLDVEWNKDEYTVSGKPKLQEQYNEPVSLPQVTHSGEVSKSILIAKDCPPGQHEHADFPYCHPADRKHRTEGGREEEAKSPSENQAGEAEEAQNQKTETKVREISSLIAESPHSTLKKVSQRPKELKVSDDPDAYFKKISKPTKSLSKANVKNVIGYTEGSRLLYGLLESKNLQEYIEQEKMTAEDLNTVIERIKNLDEAISLHTLDEGIKVFRGADGMDMFGTTDYMSLIGIERNRKAYISTSAIRDIAQEYANNEYIKNPVIIEFEVPPGEGIGMYVKEYSERKDEYEFTMKRGTNYIISKVDMNVGVAYIKARVVK